MSDQEESSHIDVEGMRLVDEAHTKAIAALMDLYEKRFGYEWEHMWRATVSISL